MADENVDDRAWVKLPLLKRKETQVLAIAVVMGIIAKWVLPVIPSFTVDAAFLERMVTLGLALFAGFFIEGMGKKDYSGAFSAMLQSTKMRAYMLGVVALVVNTFLGMYDLELPEADLQTTVNTVSTLIVGFGGLDAVKARWAG